MGKDEKKKEFEEKEKEGGDSSEDERHNYRKKEFKYKDELEDLDGLAPQKPFSDFIHDNWIKVPISHQIYEEKNGQYDTHG